VQIAGEAVFHKHAFFRTPTASQTKAQNMKAMNKKNFLYAGMAIANGDVMD